VEDLGITFVGILFLLLNGLIFGTLLESRWAAIGFGLAFPLSLVTADVFVINAVLDGGSSGFGVIARNLVPGYVAAGGVGCLFVALESADDLERLKILVGGTMSFAVAGFLHAFLLTATAGSAPFLLEVLLAFLPQLLPLFAVRNAMGLGWVPSSKPPWA
jgi:hypothetical protein